MDHKNAEAACSRLTEEMALGIAGLYASGDLSERGVEQLVELLEECWQRSRVQCRREEKEAPSADPVAARRHPQIEALLAAIDTAS